MFVNEQEVVALVDPAATANLIHPSYLPENQHIRPHHEKLNLAAEGAQLLTSGETHLRFSVQGRDFEAQLLIAPQIRQSLILGLPWLEEEQGILDLTRNVLYLGQKDRVTIPLIRVPRRQTRTPTINEGLVKHGLTGQHLEPLLKLLRQHAEVFIPLCQGLPQTRTIHHEIRVTSEQPFRLPSYRYSDQKRALIEE